MAFVFVDESMCTLNDGFLQIDTQGNNGFFPDAPANYDNSGNTMGCVDGHVEYRKWLTSPLINLPYDNQHGYGSPGSTVSGVNRANPDWQWWCQHVDYNP